MAAIKRAVCPILAGFALLARGPLAAPRVDAQGVGPPPIRILQNSGSSAEGLIFIAPQAVSAASPAQGPEIIDSRGRIVWFSPSPNGETAWNFREQTYNGNPVLTWSQSAAYGTAIPTTTIDYILDNTYTVIATVTAGNGYNADLHEFQLTPQNTALITINDIVQTDLSSVGGPTSGAVDEGSVQEIDVATGAVLFEWHSLDHVELSESHYAYTPGQTAPYDYFHINSVRLDTDGNLLISSRYMWTVYKVNRTTGAIIWRLGGKKSDFKLGSGCQFAFQHDAEAVDSSTLRIFDNESDGIAVLPYSRVILVHHDDAAMTANIVRTLVHPEGLSVYAEGNAQALANGDTFVGWGILGRISEFDSAGQLLFDAQEAPGFATYRAYRSQWVGAPATSPTAVALHNDDGTIAVHAIWNGATEVASWEVFGGDAPGALSLIMTAPWNGLDTAITIPGPVNEIQAVAISSAGAAIGTTATISGPFAAVFPTQPASQTIAEGGTVAFSAVAAGSSPAYQWLFNGSPLQNGASVSGADGPRLVIKGVTAANSGSYSCVAANLGNSATSSTAALAVSTPTDPGRLVDISCRSDVGLAGGGLIIGFVLGGQGTSGSVPVLIRASGPALASFGVPDALPDPDLRLFGTDGILAANSGWAGDSRIASTAAMAGAFPWGSASSLDSALGETLATGPFSAVITGASGDSGIALGEVYDAAPFGTRLPTTPRLINLSGRAQVGTGAKALIAGFVIGGTTSETVLIRGSGPALTQFGISNALVDPLLQVYRDNGDGAPTLLGSNAGWNGDAQIAATAASVGAFGWGASDSADSALLVTLPPGAYTAEVSGASGDTGVSLIEIYEVP
ncbi:MAG TPA: arylsulfotransferase family protein [Dongiaceae bacterium]|nr:arylsulfotransferase family protein [Dongiaceae bacterium]